MIPDSTTSDEMDYIMDLPDSDDQTDEPEAKSEETATEGEATKPPGAESSEPEAEQKPQVRGKIEVDPNHIEDAKEILDVLTSLKSDKGDLNLAALRLAGVFNKRVEEARNAAGKVAEDVYFSTPEGRAVKEHMSKYKGIPKDIAIQQVQEAVQYRMGLERSSKSENETKYGVSLNNKQKRLLNSMGMSTSDYYKRAEQINSGKIIARELDGGTLEVEMDLHPTKGDKK
jgi:hypothetical protein